MKKAMINYMKNPKNDELYTPKKAVYPLLDYLPKNITIWECTDFGESKITEVLKDNGYKVISTNIDEGFNFLTDEPNFYFDMIITNPPYSLKDEFLQRCYELNKPFCMLLPLTTLEGKKRGEMFRKYGIEVLVLDKRINFMKNKKNVWFNTSWFCWNVLNEKLIFEEVL
jgi:hypothetical protein